MHGSGAVPGDGEEDASAALTNARAVTWASSWRAWWMAAASASFTSLVRMP